MAGDNLTCEQEPRGEHASGNIFLRHVRLERAGGQVHGHRHTFDHTTIVIRGRVRVRAKPCTCSPRFRHEDANCGCPPDESPCTCHPMIEQAFDAGEHFLVKKHWVHEITALTDDVFFMCVYAHRNAQGEVVQENPGWREDALRAYQ